MKNAIDPTLCREPRCKNRRRFNRKRKRFDLRACHKHESRRKRAKDPMRAAWRALKDHAKARRSEFWPNGIPFTITLRQFIIFARASDYLNRTGLNGHCLTVDRIDNLKGYTPRNNPLSKLNETSKMGRHPNEGRTVLERKQSMKFTIETETLAAALKIASVAMVGGMQLPNP